MYFINYTGRLVTSMFAVDLNMPTNTSNVTTLTKVQSTSTRLFASTWHPLVSVITTFYFVAISFHRRVWYRALSLHYVCI